MAKGKSSATSGTRKKHARKAAAAHSEPLEPQEKKLKKEKGKKGKEPRKKVYIPPVKPAPVQPDPLDTLGIAQRIPAELLIVLRLLAKKDSVTKRRALEDFQADWVDKARKEKAEHLLHALEESLPVWLHHIPALFLHPSRRIRLLAAGIHASILKLPSPLPEQLLFTLREVLDADHTEYVVGAWCLAAHDVDRQVSAYARESWDRCVTSNVHRQEGHDDGSLPDVKDAKLHLHLDSDMFAHLWEFAQRTILDPAGVYAYVNPPQPVVAPPPGKHGGKGAQTRSKRDDDPPSRFNREEEEESETDRKARLRIGGFGIAEWVLATYTGSVEDQNQIREFIAPLDNLALWSSLYYNQSAPFVQDIESFGYNQPTVRRAAWTFLQSLMRMCKDTLRIIAPTLSVAVLRSAWVEPDSGVRGIMWQPLLTFLKEYPRAWESEVASDVAEDNDSGDESEAEGPETPQIKPAENRALVSAAYQEFRQFLELGCMGSPVHGYPAVIVILSTIPSSILASVPDPIQTLFASFWAAVDGRALSGLDRVTASAAYLSSLLECILFIVGRLLGSQGNTLAGHEASASPRDIAIQLLKDQVRRVWDELSAKRLKVEDEVAASSLCKFFDELHRTDALLFDASWKELVGLIKIQVHSTASAIPSIVPVALKVFNNSFVDGSQPREAAQDLSSEVVQITMSQFENILQTNGSVTEDPQRLQSLIAVLNAFGDIIFTDPELASAIDDTCLEHVYRLLTMFPAVLLVYLSHRKDEERCVRLWSAVLQAIRDNAPDIVDLLPPLLDAAEGGQLADYLRPFEGEMDDSVGQLMISALNDRDADSLAIVKRLLAVPEYFVTPMCLQSLVSSLCATSAGHVRDLLRSEHTTFTAMNGLIVLLSDILDKRLFSTEDIVSLLPHIFTFAFVLPQLERPDKPPTAQSEAAQDLWRSALSQASDETRSNVMVHVKQILRDIFTDCSIPMSAGAIVSLVSSAVLDVPIDVIEEILPDQAQLDAMLDKLPTSPSEPCLAVVDPLVLPGDWSEAEEWSEAEYDYAGYTVYSRIVTAFIACFRNDRQTARENIWALRHCLALAIWAKDLLQVRSSQNPVFSNKVSTAELEDIVAGARALCSFLLGHTGEEGWIRSVVDGLIQGRPRTNADGAERLLHVLVRPKTDSIRESRILYELLEHILSDASKEDADQFIRLARALQKKAPHASLAIILSVTRYASEPPTLERYRNELAADLFGISASKANAEGLWLLRRLVATAPDPESDVVFLPTPRAVNLMKACQQWITSDEDLDEEVECEMTAVFRHLAPILQNVPGAHWDLIFDVMENNLENSSFEELSSLPVLCRTLELLITVQDLVTTNKALRATWEERKTSMLTSVRDLVAKRLDAVSGNVPLSVCRELALTIVQDLPGSLLDKDTLSKMCHILTDPSDNVQRMAYKMLKESAAKYTEHLVLEAGVDSDAELKLDLPVELLSLLQTTIADSDFETAESAQVVFGHLLAWMVTFDLFTNASLKVKSGYMDHMRRTELIREYFLPRIFSILRLYDGLAKAVRLDIWAVDEYYLDLYSPDSPVSIPLLAAHLYYRSLRLVPALIRGWLVDCRDRQLSTTIMTYTSTHFSPALLQAELMQVKTPDAVAELADDNMKVKVASAVNEITASYAVDEYELEIRLKLPSDWPLHTIEIKDSKRVGVNEDRWRSWILGVQQILTFRSGSIVDGLAFFKKNVASHFEGQSECAICYSMISAMDGSLPKKPCKTCRNRFHAGCLYKWFNTSHSSSCPLCRSEIIQ